MTTALRAWLDQIAPLELIGCTDGAGTFALEMAWVRGVERGDRLEPCAGHTSAAGVLRVQGTEAPVFRLAALLGAAHEPIGRSGHVLLLEGPAGPFGLLVERLAPVARVAPHERFPLPAMLPRAWRRHFRGIVHQASTPALWLSPEELVPGRAPRRVRSTRGTSPDPCVARLPAPIPPSPRLGGQLVIFSPRSIPMRPRPLAFGLSLTQVIEIADTLPEVALPGAPLHLLGLVLWRDRALPLIDLSARLGLTAAPAGAPTRLLIARASNRSDPVALAIQPPIRMCRLPLPNVPCTQLPSLTPGLVRGAVELDAQTLVIPDLAAAAQLAP